MPRGLSGSESESIRPITDRMQRGDSGSGLLTKLYPHAPRAERPIRQTPATGLPAGVSSGRLAVLDAQGDLMVPTTARTWRGSAIPRVWRLIGRTRRAREGRTRSCRRWWTARARSGSGPAGRGTLAAASGAAASSPAGARTEGSAPRRGLVDRQRKARRTRSSGWGLRRGCRAVRPPRRRRGTFFHGGNGLGGNTVYALSDDR